METRGSLAFLFTSDWKQVDGKKGVRGKACKKIAERELIFLFTAHLNWPLSREVLEERNNLPIKNICFFVFDIEVNFLKNNFEFFYR